MHGKLKIYLIHVTGTHMIEQGMDGLTRGCLTEGVMTRKSILSFIPLNHSAIAPQPGIMNCVRRLAPFKRITQLKIVDWYDKGQGLIGRMTNDSGVWMPTEMREGWLVWDPPLVIADIVVEQLEESRHKQKNFEPCIHIHEIDDILLKEKLSRSVTSYLKSPPEQDVSGLLVIMKSC
jgi:hypothetical protein